MDNMRDDFQEDELEEGAADPLVEGVLIGDEDLDDDEEDEAELLDQFGLHVEEDEDLAL